MEDGIFSLEIQSFFMYSKVSNNKFILSKSDDFEKMGVKYYSLTNNHLYFVIIDCNLGTGRSLTSLCSKYSLVGGKMKNDKLIDSCSFGFKDVTEK